MTGFQRTFIVWAGVVVLSLAPGSAVQGAADRDRERDGGREGDRKPAMKNPHVQRGIKLLEEARAYLSQAQKRLRGGDRDKARDAERRVERALGEAGEALKAVRGKRTIETGEPRGTDRPLSAARDALVAARDQFREADGSYKGHIDSALGHVKAAMDRVRDLAKREEAKGTAGKRPKESGPGATREDKNSDNDRGLDSSPAAGLPDAVRRTVRSRVPDLAVRDVKRDGEGGGQKGIVYKIAGWSPEQGDVEMEVAEDGTLRKLELKGGGTGRAVTDRPADGNGDRDDAKKGKKGKDKEGKDKDKRGRDD